MISVGLPTTANKIAVKTRILFSERHDDYFKNDLWLIMPSSRINLYRIIINYFIDESMFLIDPSRPVSREIMLKLLWFSSTRRRMLGQFCQEY